jgi:hypothetical protein
MAIFSTNAGPVSAMESIGASSLEAWESLNSSAPRLEGYRPFSHMLKNGYTNAIKTFIPSEEEFNTLKRIIETGGLEGKEVAIAGAGTFGLTLALGLSEAGAKVKIYSSATKPTAMARALGIGEPQGQEVEGYFHATIPLFESLIANGAPIEKNKVIYYSADERASDDDFVKELERMPGSNYKIEAVSEFGDKVHGKLSFDGFIFSGAGLRDFYMNILKNNPNVEFQEREFQEVAPILGKDNTPADISFFALGLGRGKIEGAHIPGNRGQMLIVEGEEVKKLLEANPMFNDVGSLGIPTDEGSVNIVVRYGNFETKENPVLVIGATKDKGVDKLLPTEKDYNFLREGVKLIWPELDAAIEKAESLQEDAPSLTSCTYVCVRPGAGDPFTIKETNGCIDIYAAGGTGNSIAGGAALKALSMALRNMS